MVLKKLINGGGDAVNVHHASYGRKAIKNLVKGSIYKLVYR